MGDFNIEGGVSVVICCYNSSTRIGPTLEHLAAQIIPEELQWEVILVNNNSTDNTEKKAKNTWQQLGVPTQLRVVSETRAGLSYAREKGIDAANFEYVLFCDDDNWLEQEYLRKSIKILSGNSDIGVVGGRSEAFFDIPVPSWFSTFQSSYAVGVQALYTGDVTDRGFLWGAGMMFRKSVYCELKSAGFKSLLADRKGQVLSSGGDSELCKWFILAGFKLYYSEELAFKHFISDDRLTKDYLERLLKGFSSSQRILRKYDLVVKRNNLDTVNVWKKFFQQLIFFVYARLRGAPTTRIIERLSAFSPFSSFLLDEDTRTIVSSWKCYLANRINR